jgi:hypothetical protein
MKTQNKTNKTMTNKATAQAKVTLVTPAQVTKVTPAPVKTTKVVSEKSTKVVSQAFLVPTSTKVDYRNAKKSLTKTYKDEIGSISFILNFIKTNPKGRLFTSQFVSFSEADLTPKNMFSVMKETERYLTQIFDLTDGTTERRISYDIKGEPMKRERFSIGTIENCVERFCKAKYESQELAKASIKKSK